MSAIATAERAKTAIDLGESHFREFKSALDGRPGEKKKRPIKEIATDIAQTLVAFANADGGELLVGVEDNGDISGIPTLSASEWEILDNAARDRIHKDTPLPSVKRQKISIDGKTLLYLSVPKSTEYVHVTSDGRCLQRRDLESVPVSAEVIQFDRREKGSREYDRQFVDGVTADDLDLDLVRIVADQLMKGMSVEKCLQYLELAEYGNSQLRYRRAALLLFSKDPSKWHPRLQVRILKVDGDEVKTGEAYNIVSDNITRGNVLRLVDSAWEALRPHLVQTKIDKQARFEQRSIYPELACREAVLNSIAHRDYSDEGRGTEIYIFDNTLEIRNPGALLSTIRIRDIMERKGVHQSRNTYVSRVLRELGYMRELGEGMRRIYDLMHSNELAPPQLESTTDGFSITLTNKAMYSQNDLLWLSQFDDFDLDRKQKAIVLLGQGGRIFSAANVWDAVGIVDTEDYRKLVDSLLKMGILQNEVERSVAQKLARRKKIPYKEYPRYKIGLPQPEKTDTKTVESTHSSIKSENSTNEPSNIDSCRIFIGNLPSDIGNQELFDIFSEIGDIVDLRVPRYGTRSKGFAFIEFSSPESAKIAINRTENDPILYKDRKLVINSALRKTGKATR
ncbi:ATP-binding protein [Burkholderia sp. BCCIQ04A]|uniref:ATP-binding protein n=1 Tax=Burkholderia anthinoferrum TaxID=3090833 RepID=A0ABU5WTC3_9BURK|nr:MULTISPECIES: ATP-binding protein [Burkholderia]MEB2505338.1 ATP-binding protein [Burkholderia anthinoferrum]MEB2530009.1 ATP-binding protein [Burkholderia anthinoferrum]MEB2563557.1 ATP-binding protein [Burkholderia anthinoferrum]MEB2582247.1 ATP-binding protein [Burkholderia anthinoferrum]MCA8107998.1 putative DNA binding domain-containing protein [Burkholderia sp. AU36459]